MTLLDFKDKYCKMCASQRCGGIHDVVFREGCKDFQREILGIKIPSEVDYQNILSEILNWEEWKLQTALDFGLFSSKTMNDLLQLKRELKEENESHEIS